MMEEVENQAIGSSGSGSGAGSGSAGGGSSHHHLVPNDHPPSTPRLASTTPPITSLYPAAYSPVYSSYYTSRKPTSAYYPVLTGALSSFFYHTIPHCHVLHVPLFPCTFLFPRSYSFLYPFHFPPSLSHTFTILSLIFLSFLSSLFSVVHFSIHL